MAEPMAEQTGLRECPILSAATRLAPSRTDGLDHQLAICVEDICAWWDSGFKRCAIIGALDELMDIRIALDGDKPLSVEVKALALDANAVREIVTKIADEVSRQPEGPRHRDLG